MGRGQPGGSPGGGRSFRSQLLSRVRGRGRGSSAPASPPHANARRVVVKAHLLRMGASGAKAAALHVRYIERDGVDKDGSKGTLYDASGAARAASFEQPRAGEKHQFRLIVSPEDGAELDLTAYVRGLMATLERDVGRKVEWAAVNHYDTSHPHAHIVIRGIDRDGQELRIDRSYIAAGLRGRAQELATDELGPRLEVDVERARAREVTQERFTSLDREIERRAPDRHLDIRGGARPGRVDASVLVARLEHLEGLALAERVSRTSWRLAGGWQQRLRDRGARGDILQQIHAAVGGDPARYDVVRPGEALAPETSAPSRAVTGRVATKGLSDELRGRYYAVIETPTGRAYHVPIDARSAESLRPGDIVSLATPPETAVRPADRRIVEAARAGGGLYVAEPKADGASHPHARRLRELERLGLATAEAPGRWRVPPDLLERLVAQAREAPPRHRLVIHKEPLPLRDQISHPGPVWLDRVEATSLARYGLGGDVRRALAERREVLQRLGIAPDDPNRVAKLREMQRRALGTQIAARSGLAFLPRIPEGFRGRVQPAGSPALSGAYTLVSDGRRFVVLRTTPALRAFMGKTVAVTRGPKGRLVVRPAPDRDRDR